MSKCVHVCVGRVACMCAYIRVCAFVCVRMANVCALICVRVADACVLVCLLACVSMDAVCVLLCLPLDAPEVLMAVCVGLRSRVSEALSESGRLG